MGNIGPRIGKVGVLELELPPTTTGIISGELSLEGALILLPISLLAVLRRALR